MANLSTPASISDSALSMMASGPGLNCRRLVRVVAFITDHLQDTITIERLAAEACLSQFHFARAFKAAAGRPPHQYVSEKRLQHAKTLLAASDRSLYDVAQACGFSSQANFSKAFRRATGVAPGQYRGLIRMQKSSAA